MTVFCDHCGQAVPEWDGIVLDDDRGEMRAGGYSVHLTGKESAVLRLLLDKKGRVANKEAILDQLYQLDPDGGAEEKIIDVFICKIRRKIKATGVVIGTAWGRGYYLEPKGQQTDAAE